MTCKNKITTYPDPNNAITPSEFMSDFITTPVITVCGKPNATIITHDNLHICQGCFTNHYHNCFHCEKIFNNLKLYTTKNHHYCETCSESVTFICSECDDRLELEFRYEEGVNTCRYCQQNSTECSSCGEFNDHDSTYYCDNCDNSYCDNCWPEHEHNPDNECLYRLVNLTHLTGSIKGKFLTVNRLIGFEIECSDGKKSNLDKDLDRAVGITTDGSIGSMGLEIQTPPASLNLAEDLIIKTCKTLQDHKFRGTLACGLHLHVDCSDILDNPDKIVQVIKTIFSIEDMLYSMLPPSRWSSKYCKMLHNEYLYADLKKHLKSIELEKLWYKDSNKEKINKRKSNKWDNTRYYGLNMHSLFFRGTIEFRYHSGTTNAEKILWWAELILKIVDYAVNRYDELQIQQLFNLETGWIKWEFLKKILDLSYPHQNYIQSRIAKFNPNFMIKFNLGRNKRITDKTQLTKYKQKIKRLINLEAKRLKPIMEANFILYNPSMANEVTSFVKDEVTKKAKEIILNKIPQEMQKKYTEGGFIKETELENILQYINQGRNMTVNNNSESEDQE